MVVRVRVKLKPLKAVGEVVESVAVLNVNAMTPNWSSNRTSKN